MPAAISLDRDRIVEFCERNPILKLSLFGSILRDDFDQESDVDMLVELDPEGPRRLLQAGRHGGRTRGDSRPP